MINERKQMYTRMKKINQMLENSISKIREPSLMVEKCFLGFINIKI